MKNQDKPTLRLCQYDGDRPGSIRFVLELVAGGVTLSYDSRASYSGKAQLRVGWDLAKKKAKEVAQSLGLEVEEKPSLYNP